MTLQSSDASIGRLIGIARRGARRAPMEEVDAVDVSLARGVEGDHKGVKFRNRAVTVLSIEAWRAALSDLVDDDGSLPDLHWTVRRANLLVEGVALPRARGGVIRIGPIELEVTYPTQPCKRMDDAYPGLLKALHPDWRGGITGRVLKEGKVKLGDAVEVLVRPPEKRIRLPA